MELIWRVAYLEKRDMLGREDCKKLSGRELLAHGFQVSVKLLKLVCKTEYCLCIFLGRAHNFIKFSEGSVTQKQTCVGLKTLGH